MKTRPWIPLLLLSICLPCGAAWTYVDSSDGYERYLDRATLQRDGRLAQVWEVDDRPVPDPSGLHSLHSHTEYDCQAKQYRVTYLSGHSERMTQGAVLFAGPGDGEWKPVRPDTLGELSMDMACEDPDEDDDAQ
jgi:hypothetical protein